MKLNLNKDKKYLLACSFGPDSMALFHLLLEENYVFEVAHVNYHMREESNDEESKLRNFCKGNSVRFHSIDAYYQTQFGNFQAWARNERYHFFARILKENELQCVLTAHHLDDVLETYLMQKAQKKTLFSYGIPEEITLQGVKVLRPLLSYTKTDLKALCDNNNVPYSLDKSNFENKYRRNYYRNVVLSKLSIEEKHLLLLEMNERSRSEAEKTAKVTGLIKDNNVVKIDQFQTLNLDEKQRLIYILFDKLCYGYVYTNGLFNQIEKLLLSNKSTQLVKLKNDVYLSKYYGEFTLINIKDFEPYEVIVGARYSRFRTEHIDFDLTGDLSRYNITSESYPLTIRSAKKEDYYQIKSYSKKVSRLFIDMKLPKHLRRIWPLIVDKSGKIIYIPRYRSTYTAKEEDKLQVLW